jgi:16S rRNA (uracil1498-N3)-methyltransferase
MIPPMSNPPPPTAATAAQAAESTSIRLYVTDPLQDGGRVSLTAPQSHYLGTVMRRGRNDRLRVFNGVDGEHLATITEIKRDRCVLRVGPMLREQAPDADIWIAFALLKRGPTDLIVQKATELGVAAIMPLFTTRTNADRTNAARLQAIAIEAAEQSERLNVPTVHLPRALSALLAGWPSDRRLVACFERSADAPIGRHAGEKLGLLIGPEGGFTDAELDAVRACPFVEAATLGPRVLRADTAAIVGLALLQAA